MVWLELNLIILNRMNKKDVKRPSFNGKAIYTHKPAAAEYGRVACNCYRGCPCGCKYCYNNRWGWGLTPVLKERFRDEMHALEVFERELNENLQELHK